ncbi:hypothetical protein NC651_012301 [Populus alba x Populus x berolinensis]|nr:hypothetical protein NC651_012301 [Populus alba x Populus x berolinensis]
MQPHQFHHRHYTIQAYTTSHFKVPWLLGDDIVEIPWLLSGVHECWGNSDR